ncbi:MAG: hypothetical protein ACLFQY_03230 [Desulfococcaceae bacterium]
MNKNSKQNGFGTFGGVFTPNILTILGIILFLRTGWVVGNAGMVNALIMALIANAITFLTALSLSGIATNIRVQTGGAYYMISRSLGAEIGGSIGIPLYLSQAVSVAFYLIGFAEAFHGMFPQYDPVHVASFTCLLFAVVAMIGADFAIKIQYFILATLFLSLVSFFAGGTGQDLSLHLRPDYTGGHHFWSVFAIFFPAVTGIMSGISMSGDLKHPERSIPRGTLLSVGLAFVIYSLTIVWFAANAAPAELQTNRFVMKEISRWPALFYAGVWAATLSSGLASMVGAPRVLQSLSFDNIVPRYFAGRMGSVREPRFAVIITYGIAQSVILLGNLDVVAPVISMFFLNTYGMLNLAAGLEGLSGNPSYRPTIRIHWSLSFLGAAGCYGAMCLIHIPATLIAVVVSYAIYFSLKKRFLHQYWGDARSGILFSAAQFILAKLEEQPPHAKNWKPNMMVFTGNPRTRPALSRLSRWLSKGNGIITFFQVVVGDPEDKKALKIAESARHTLDTFIRENRVTAFPEVQVVRDFEEGVSVISQAHGIGRLKPNIALFGMGRTAKQYEKQLRVVKRVLARNSVILLKSDPDREFGERRTIDLWWGGMGGNGDLMLLLAHLIAQNDDWRGAVIRAIKVIKDPGGIGHAHDNIQKLLDEMRLNARAMVIALGDSPKPFEKILAKHSRNADLTILGIRPFDKGQEPEIAARIHKLTENLSTVLLVRSSGTGDLLKASR